MDKLKSRNDSYVVEHDASTKVFCKILPRLLFFGSMTAVVMLSVFWKLCMQTLAPTKALRNLVPGFPHVLQYNSSSYAIYPNLIGMQAYECPELELDESVQLNSSILVQFHQEFSKFSFKVTGYISFNLSLVDIKTNQTATDVLIYQDGQRQRTRMLSCTNVACTFEIRSTLPTQQIEVTVNTWGVRTEHCAPIASLLQQEITHTEMPCSFFPVRNPANIVVLLHNRTTTEWGFRQNVEFALYRFQKMDASHVLQIVLVLASGSMISALGIGVIISLRRQ